MFAKGILRLKLTSGDTAGLLRRLNQQGIALWNVENLDYFSVQISCSAQDRKIVEDLSQKLGAEIQVTDDTTLRKRSGTLLRRPVMICGFLLLMVLALFLPTRVLFIQVDGNIHIPQSLILEKAEDCGIHFGASRRAVRSERVKNALLEVMPQLQWAGINTSGCVATISVREKTLEEVQPYKNGVGSIVATTDGVVENCTVENGTALCRTGEAVVAGQILVSGYTDCGITLKAVRAQAEITATTMRNITAVTLANQTKKGTKLTDETKYSLRIGKKLINFFKDSGISDTSCDKMYSEKWLTLPGGFQLPVALVIQNCIDYTEEAIPVENAAWLPVYCEEYLLGHMQGGSILVQHTDLDLQKGAYVLNGEYICLENIGQFVNEEIINYDGQTN